MNRFISAGVLAGVVIIASGCAQKRVPALYGWDNYQQQVYTYLKDEGASPVEQISTLEKGLQSMQARGANAPPGYHAHLGMLYASVGQEDQMMRELEAEKRLFPESQPYMDFLLRKYQTKQVTK
ncbi:DUF4810 domain-containing protein [Herbaspirillum sp. alder98]|uniref:DUF4810 domain-containing protein n=1 Tax=Herbaspirillum sp. alder98 TaxID=2913096 RepID=UPI001CD8C4DC|nr:DUF4810 domain-containing protein [Herbaspirillum sp. alder98]MCA1324667.1 DUF4810 domain-containing protein [Herbaspirillum sp. alder98]